MRPASRPGSVGASAGQTLARVGRWLGPAVFLVFLAAAAPAGVSAEAWIVLGLTLLMATWWITEAAPIPVTALLPVAVLPVLGVVPIAEATAPYANPLIFLFVGGFSVALAVQRWNLHRRVALAILHLSGNRLDRLVGGFMLATAGLSMWVSNTATAALMLPIALSVLALVESDPQARGTGSRPAVALLLGIAFAANIGGMATLIGSPPNALTAAFLNERYGLEIGFVQWLAMGLPVSAALLAFTWWSLTHWVFPVHRIGLEGLDELLAGQRAELGGWSSAERRVAVIFVLVALAWLFRPLLNEWLPVELTDAGIAVLGAAVLFVVPSGRTEQRYLLAWENTRDLPWGVLVLVGGGLSLGAAIEGSGLAGLAAQSLQGAVDLPLWLLVFGVIVLTMGLSHVTSNTATAATLLPLVAALALQVQAAPLLLAIPVALAASAAFMLPVATPPNAIVFGSDRLAVLDMVRGGALPSLVSVLVLVIVAMTWVGVIFGAG
ncbi:anion transporter [Thioalkalivibrio nitratireducens DSM 14787]|uniref:Anion transporter n=1 Tax=Thioalkalivibrio nitratireducens (strain DSM 14787 / UNIQEM 213 / ALEN2) TaxID=1255043 RepID=L0DX85_THIND|nr:SLC13 family permease [Thioalkalivibrio nitratireducens]AGA32956.1 anion transporter [Thioalkalivibrio nitratireducens DSM 14787]